MTTDELSQLLYDLCSDVTITTEKVFSRIVEKAQIILDTTTTNKVKEEIKNYRFNNIGLYETAKKINKLLDMPTDPKGFYRYNLLQQAIDELLKQKH